MLSLTARMPATTRLRFALAAGAALCTRAVGAPVHAPLQAPAAPTPNATCATPEYPDIRSVAPDLFTPPMINGTPAAGLRVRQTLPSFAGTNMYHFVYLPSNWSPTGGPYPILAEYGGNGPWQSVYGDYSCGKPDCYNMGYGLSGGMDFIWIGLPFGDVNGSNVESYWWGCPQPATAPAHCPGFYNTTPTLDYTAQAVKGAAAYNGNLSAVFLTGWSRGALAVNYMGLHNDAIAPLWRAFLPYSHYDGRSTDQWVPYPDQDPASAITRLKRLNGRPSFITEERNGTDDTAAFLNSTGLDLNVRIMSTGFCNHNDAWTLRPSTARTAMREWLQGVLNGTVPS